MRSAATTCTPCSGQSCTSRNARRRASSAPGTPAQVPVDGPDVGLRTPANSAAAATRLAAPPAIKSATRRSVAVSSLPDPFAPPRAGVLFSPARRGRGRGGRACVSAGPVLVAIDDAQWLDAASLDALT